MSFDKKKKKTPLAMKGHANPPSVSNSPQNGAESEAADKTRADPTEAKQE